MDAERRGEKVAYLGGGGVGALRDDVTALLVPQKGRGAALHLGRVPRAGEDGLHDARRVAQPTAQRKGVDVALHLGQREGRDVADA